MNTIQQNSFNSSPLKEPEVSTWFYFILGMILVIGSGTTASSENISSNDSDPIEILSYENQENFSIEFTDPNDVSL